MKSDVPDRAVEAKKCKSTVGPGSVLRDQCSRDAVRGGYCWQHHPDAVTERMEKSDKKWHAKQRAEELAAYRLHVEQFIDGLKYEDVRDAVQKARVVLRNTPAEDQRHALDFRTALAAAQKALSRELKRLIPTPEGKTK